MNNNSKMSKFLEKTKTVHNIIGIRIDKPNFTQGTQLFVAYDIEIKNPRGTITTTYYDCQHVEEVMRWAGIYSDKNLLISKFFKYAPLLTDVLETMMIQHPGTIDDFMVDYGYELNNTNDICELIQTYNNCIDEYMKICKIFTEEEREELSEAIEI